MGEQRELEVKVEHLVVENEEKQLEGDSGTAIESDVKALGSARSWFTQLTEQDRMAVFSFADDSFIDALLQVASSSSTRTIAEESVGAALPAHAVLGPHKTGWESMFMIKEFAKLYEAFKEKARVEVAISSESVDNISPSIPSESNETNEENETQPEATEKVASSKSIVMSEELDVDDAFRIHGSIKQAVGAGDDGKKIEVEKSLAIANGKKAAALALSSLAKQAGNTSIDSSQELLVVRNFQLIFPSVVEFAQGSTSTEVISSPVVTITPSFVKETSSIEIVDLFDAVLGGGGRPPFLSDSIYCKMVEGNSSNNWLLRLCGGDGEVSMESSSTTLSLLLVARLEHAVFEVYAARVQHSRKTVGDMEIKEEVDDSDSKPVSLIPEEADGSISDQWATAPEEESSDDQNTDERSFNGRNARGGNSSSEFFDAESSVEKALTERRINANTVSQVCYFDMKRPLVVSQNGIISSLSSSIRMFDETYQNDNLAGGLLEVLSPLLNLVDVRGSLDESQLKASNLIMAPLVWFLGQGKHTDVKTISRAVESSLKRLTDCADSSKCIEFPSHNESNANCVASKGLPAPEVVDSNRLGGIRAASASVDGESDNIDTSNSSKKLKKKKKRKKRKSLNLEAEEFTSQSFQQSAHEGKKELEKLTMPDTEEAVVVAETIASSTSVTIEHYEVGPILETGERAMVLANEHAVSGGEIDPLIAAQDLPLSGVDSASGQSHTVGDALTQSETAEDDGDDQGEDDRHDETGTADDDDDGSAWETVENRARTSRKNSGDRGNYGSGRTGSYHHSGGAYAHHSYSSFNGMNGSFSKKSKGARTAASRKRTANRKMVREILTSVLDAVDEELVRRKKPTTRPASVIKAVQVSQAPAITQRVENSRPVTLRDLVVGSVTESSEGIQKPHPQSAVTPSEPGNGLRTPSVKKAEKRADGRCEPALEKTRPSIKIVADQNTAPTVPETMSAVSTNSMNTDGLFGVGSFRRSSETGVDLDVARSDSSCEELIETDKDIRISCSTTDEKESSPAPPLPTLLSPGNPDSASSSVASSLEVPHGHHHHRSYTATENVGYHLLDVCDRLTRDMNVFMDRRGLALNVRRRERGELLTALQETLTKLWPGRCNVNMYGSCATQLDLPSSDLDVVVCGLDRKGESSPSSIPQKSNKKSGRRGSASSTDPEAVEFSPRGDLLTQYMQSQPGMLHYSPFSPFTPVQINGERVIRLAAELERQPWAVHVKAVPTATVPVVKILADPAKLPGAKAIGAGASDWISHHQQMAAIAAGISSAVAASSGPHYHPLHNPLPWRGADVMNGLMSVDITFEGPEHGGIGSTKLSSRIVKEACEEYACPPERVPLVQVLMVLKEMLAQRRLNEPFSGGLSSYALLLLVEALVKERAVIREELERVERQRRVVAAGGGNASLGESNARKKKSDHGSSLRLNQRDQPVGTIDRRTASFTSADVVKGKASNAVISQPLEGASLKTAPKASESNLNPSNDKAQPTLKKAASTSSWASVAKKNTGTSQKGVPDHSRSEDPSPVVQPNTASNQILVKPKASTFADAVARSVEITRPRVVVDSKRSTRDDQNDALLKNDATKSRSAPVQSKSSNSKTGLKVGQAVRSEENHGALPSPGVTSDHVRQPPTRLNSSTVSIDSALVGAPQLFPQGSNDVVEVLCSGETTAGKLLMHFLLFYGQHFDARTTAIDVSGTHLDVNRPSSRNASHTPMSPYIQRRPGGTIDPVSGMLTVDPIVVYDPLEGSESNNVARSCFLWSNIRWVFAQSYNTLSSAVERSPTPPSTPGRQKQQQKVLTTKSAAVAQEALVKSVTNNNGKEIASWQTPFVRDDEGQPPVDSPLLELLLSF